MNIDVSYSHTTYERVPGCATICGSENPSDGSIAEIAAASGKEDVLVRRINRERCDALLAKPEEVPFTGSVDGFIVVVDGIGTGKPHHSEKESKESEIDRGS